MDTFELESEVAAPIQVIGMSYYFDPATSDYGKQHGLNVFEFYGIGRGGVLGDVNSTTVAEAFWFFHQKAIDGQWNSSSQKVTPTLGAAEHLQAAYQFADRVLANVPTDVLQAFADAAFKAINTAPLGRYALADGYRKFPVPSNAIHAAYLASIILRELRGGVHIDTTREFNIAANEACYMANASIFKLHGYSDDDVPEVTSDLESRMRDAEELTTKTMASYLDVLSDTERTAFAAGVSAMNDAIVNPPGGSDSK